MKINRFGERLEVSDPLTVSSAQCQLVPQLAQGVFCRRLRERCASEIFKGFENILEVGNSRRNAQAVPVKHVLVVVHLGEFTIVWDSVERAGAHDSFVVVASGWLQDWREFLVPTIEFCGGIQVGEKSLTGQEPRGAVAFCVFKHIWG